MKSLTAGLLALTLSLTSLSPGAARAETNGDDIAVGVLTLLLLGLAIKEARDDDRGTPARQPQVHLPRHDAQPQRPQFGQQRPNTAWWVVPAECRRTLGTRQGEVRLFLQHCMAREWGPTHRLPGECFREVRLRNGEIRRGWVPHCLGRAGFVASDRR
ncbi:MAG: hypothetical protein HLUCCA08_10630 [Rhodobacteraceae bacterium HLUCCA08]|nr:MAG: hypothetical protein HLUCCA08_10630 [Rhodobacteraceae bacterium HLUCCA08]